MKRLKLILTVFVVVIALNSCSQNTGQDAENALKETLGTQISKSEEGLERKIVHEKLTESIIDATPDEQLLQVVLDNLSSKLPEDYKSDYDTVLTWNKARQAIYVIGYLEAEVNKGGFYQFYANSGGQYCSLLIASLKLVNASKFAELISRVNRVYEMEKPAPTEADSKSEGNSPLNKFDAEFYKLYENENLPQIQIDFIRNHKIEFVDH